MAQTTERVLRLLALLQARPVWTGPELATRLGVTTRSIRRDVERLRELGYPVNAAQGRGGGYQLGAGRELPPLLLDDDEVVAVAVALRLATGGTVAGAEEAALRTLTKLDQVLPPRLRHHVRTLQEATALLPSSAPTIDPELLMGLARACRDRVRVRFGYAARDGATSRRDVEPVQLVATGRRWYLFGWDTDREDWRTFRLDRMAGLEVTTWRCPARSHPDPVSHVQQALVAAPYRHVARVRVHAPAEQVRARVSPDAAAVEAVDAGTCLLTAGGDDLVWLGLHLAALGFELDVLEPPELRLRMRDLGERLLRAGRGPAR